MDTLMKMEPLSVNLCEILDRSVEQYCRFKKDEQSQSQLDLLRSSFHLIQAENGTFSQPLFFLLISDIAMTSSPNVRTIHQNFFSTR